MKSNPLFLCASSSKSLSTSLLSIIALFFLPILLLLLSYPPSLSFHHLLERHETINHLLAPSVGTFMRKSWGNERVEGKEEGLANLRLVIQTYFSVSRWWTERQEKMNTVSAKGWENARQDDDHHFQELDDGSVEVSIPSVNHDAKNKEQPNLCNSWGHEIEWQVIV